MQNDDVLRLRLGKQLKADLSALADADKRKLSDYVRLVLQQHVDRTKKNKR